MELAEIIIAIVLAVMGLAGGFVTWVLSQLNGKYKSLKDDYDEKIERLELSSDVKDNNINTEIQRKWNEERQNIQRLDDNVKANHKELVEEGKNLRERYLSKSDYDRIQKAKE